MPEGHTIHRLALDQSRGLAGNELRVSSPQGRHPLLSASLDGQTLTQVEAHGKHLFYHWQSAPVLHIHLGLIGSLREWPSPPPPPKASVQLRLEGPTATFDLVGATTTELIDGERYRHILARLGPDVLAPEADRKRAWQRLMRKRSVPIGTALLDQQTLSGVGNVYRTEALFVNGIHPLRPANSLSPVEFDQLWTTLVTMLRQGVEDRRIITVHASERADTNGTHTIGPEDAFYIYKRDFCRRCGTPIRTWQLGARRAYACEHCQPPQ